eukprot:1157152-Pelagomonas_calceolata.AAC.7
MSGCSYQACAWSCALAMRKQRRPFWPRLYRLEGEQAGAVLFQHGTFGENEWLRLSSLRMELCAGHEKAAKTVIAKALQMRRGDRLVQSSFCMVMLAKWVAAAIKPAHGAARRP